MIFLVSGFDRSGTSMMAFALKTGGLTLHYDWLLEMHLYRNVPISNYHPNPNGFFNGNNLEEIKEKSPLWFENKVMKISYDQVTSLPIYEYKIVWMLRDSESIKRSLIISGYNNMNEDPYGTQLETINFVKETRKDIDIIPIYYDDVVDNPEREFQKIKDFGIPIDVQKASSIVDPKLRRNGNELQNIIT